MDEQIIRDLFGDCISAAEILGRDGDFRDQLASPRAAGAQSNRQGRPTSGMAGRLGHASPRHSSPPRFAPLRLFPQRPDYAPRHAGTGSRRAQVAGNSRRQCHGLGTWLAAEPVGPASGSRARLQNSGHALGSFAHVSRTCSTPIRRSRSTAISAARRALPRCCCKAMPARSNSCPPCLRPGPTDRSAALGPAAVSRSISSGKRPPGFGQHPLAGGKSLPPALRRNHSRCDDQKRRFIPLGRALNYSTATKCM